jgi:uncharacterized membrane protein YbaN (DUF454 family)
MPEKEKNCQNSKKELTKFAKAVYLLIGFFTLTLGIIGIVIPILPTTPFLLLSAGCFARSSEKFYNWLINNKILGAYIRNYREGTGMPVKIKALTISLLWVTILLSVFLFITINWIKYLLIFIGIAVTIHIILIRPKKEKNT